MSVQTRDSKRLRRRRRVRAKVRGTAERPRLAVFRSNKGVQAQLIDDVAGHTLAAVNWTEKDLKELGRMEGVADEDQSGDPHAEEGPQVVDLGRMEQATRAGTVLAERAKSAGIETVVFDRGGYRYHGRVKAIADGAREAGLRF